MLFYVAGISTGVIKEMITSIKICNDPASRKQNFLQNIYPGVHIQHAMELHTPAQTFRGADARPDVTRRREEEEEKDEEQERG